MIKKEGGQIFIITAVFLVIFLLFMAVMIDGSRLLMEKQHLTRAAEAAGKTGLIVVADQMVTQVVEAQAAMAKIPITSTPINNTPGPTQMPIPDRDDFFSWINNSHRNTLVAPAMRTLVATHVIGSAEDNGVGLSNPSITGIEVIYPDQYDLENPKIHLVVRIRRTLPIVFGSLFGFEKGVLTGESNQSIPQY